MAQLSALTYNINRGKNQDAMSAVEFIYDPIAAAERQQKRDEAVLDMFDALAAKEQENNG